MRTEDREDTTIYTVVVNHEEQYSIWPSYKPMPKGWRDAGKSGLKAECLAHIKEVWVDMRPLSVRKQMERLAQMRLEAPKEENKTNGSEERVKEKSLVERLSTGTHPVEVSIRPERNVEEFKLCLDRAYAHIKFTGTRGGTELGVNLENGVIDLSKADFENQRGSVHLVGELRLDYVDVRCIADIDLETLTGEGHLEPVHS